MISIITCHNNDVNYAEFEKSIKNTIGVEYEIIKIDNTDSISFLTRAYNDGIDQAKGDILVFAHEDIVFNTNNWGIVLDEKLKPGVGVLGVAGAKILLQNAQWWATGKDYCCGKVVHNPENGSRYRSIFSEGSGEHEVVVADGLFMSCRKSTIEENSLKFDETFDNYHFYDISFCFESFLKGLKNIVTYGIEVEHKSIGEIGPEWSHYRAVFIKKYLNKLPQCVPGVIFDQSTFVRKDFETEHL
jgi:glycosyltransferase involved in cell wall biosynthesis